MSLLELRATALPCGAQRLMLMASLTLPLAGCSGGEGAAVDTMVFIDTVTRRPVVQVASTEFPAVNLATGKRTLRPAAYCDACRAWHAIPPIEELQRRPAAMKCAKTKTPLRFDGPRPPGDR